MKSAPANSAVVNTRRMISSENRESRTENREPRTKNREPRTENREPRTENREPRTENREPRTENREPRTENPRTCMWTGTPLFPDSASTMAGRVDALYFFLISVSVFFSLLIAGLIVFYAVKYRRRAPDSVGATFHGGMVLELTWTVIPFFITIAIFVWGASVFFAMSRPPD